MSTQTMLPDEIMSQIKTFIDQVSEAIDSPLDRSRATEAITLLFEGAHPPDEHLGRILFARDPMDASIIAYDLRRGAELPPLGIDPVPSITGKDLPTLSEGVRECIKLIHQGALWPNLDTKSLEIVTKAYLMETLGDYEPGPDDIAFRRGLEDVPFLITMQPAGRGKGDFVAISCEKPDVQFLEDGVMNVGYPSGYILQARDGVVERSGYST